MKVIELYKHLAEVIARNPDVISEAEVVFRAFGRDVMQKADFTLTYMSERRQGTTQFDQVPVLLIEPEEWACKHCNYSNIGPICTHCGVPRGKA